MSRLPPDAKIYVAGHDSPLGRRLCRKLAEAGHLVVTRAPHELNLRSQVDVNLFFEQELPDYVFLAGSHTPELVDHVMHPAEFLYGRLLSLSNVIHASYVYEVRKLLNAILELAPPPSEPEDGPSTESLIEMVTVGLCDRYRKQYSCDFITARFVHDEALVGAAAERHWVSPDPAGERLYASDPADACLFLMDHVSATGAIAVRTGAGNLLVP